MIDIPPGTGQALGAIFASGVTAMLSYFGGKFRGNIEGKTEFINSVEKAAALVIEKLEFQLNRSDAMHQECLAKHNECEVKYENLAKTIDELMAGKVPFHHLNKE